MGVQGWAKVVDFYPIHTLVLLKGVNRLKVKTNIEMSELGRLVTSKTLQPTQATA